MVRPPYMALLQLRGFRIHARQSIAPAITTRCRASCSYVPLVLFSTALRLVSSQAARMLSLRRSSTAPSKDLRMRGLNYSHSASASFLSPPLRRERQNNLSSGFKRSPGPDGEVPLPSFGLQVVIPEFFASLIEPLAASHGIANRIL